MEKSLEQVKEFMLTFKQPVQEITHQIEEDRAKLRLSLLLEELHELSLAYGLDRYFKDMCHNITTKSTYTNVANRVEELDALVDLKYVLNGAVLEGGFGECFDEAFEEVHNNNMTKAASTRKEVAATVNKYITQNRTVKVEEHNGKFIIFDAFSKKALKAANYVPVNLSGILEKAIKNSLNQTKLEI
jgi:predicted HAD superfamily Cof-like phosphohydrolase